MIVACICDAVACADAGDVARRGGDGPLPVQADLPAPPAAGDQQQDGGGRVPRRARQPRESLHRVTLSPCPEAYDFPLSLLAFF